jgi:hypothetical protein
VSDRLPNRSHGKIMQLPAEVRERIDDWIVGAPDRLTYQQISEELRELGYEIGVSAIGRYARRFEAMLERHRKNTERADVILRRLNVENRSAEDATIKLLRSLALEAAADSTPQQIESIKDLVQVCHAVGRLESVDLSREKLEQSREAAVNAAVDAVKRRLTERIEANPDLLSELFDLTDEAGAEVLAQEKP